MFVTRLFLALGKLFFVALLAFAISPGQALASTSNATEDELATLILQLVDADKHTRTNAFSGIRRYGQDALPFLLKTFHDGDASQRKGCVVGILTMPYPALGMDALVEALGDADPETRSLAARGLAVIGKPAAPTLVALLNSEESAVRNAAGFSLKLMGSKAVPALMESLTNSDEFVRAKSAWLLGRMGEDAVQAVPALIRALDTADIRVMHVIAEAIDLIGANPGVIAHQLILLDVETEGCPARRIGGNAAPVLVRLLSRPGTPLGQATYHSLAFIGEPAIPALMKGAQGGHMSKRVACALIILNIDPDAANELPRDVLAAIRHEQRQPQQ